MARFGKKEKKAEKAAPKAAGGGALPKQVKQPKPPKPSKPSVPPDIYTVLLGLAALFFIVATLVLGLNYYWYQSIDPAVVPLNWAK
jgi:hypothetical protein